jgi:tetratricopeptide (TPR) repeat protein
MYILLFSLIFFTPNFAHSADLWNDGIENYQKGDFQSAIKNWETWITQEQISSPEVYYNLAAAYSHLNQYGPAMRSLLKSASLGCSPSKLFAKLNLARAIENKIGVKDGASQKLALKLYFLFNSNVIAYLVAIGFWALAFLALLKFTSHLKLVPGVIATVIAVATLSLATAAWANRKFFLNPKVLDSNTGSIALMKSPTDNPAEHLIDLPPGTIVNLGLGTNLESEKYVEINIPLAGWVNRNSVQSISGQH